MTNVQIAALMAKLDRRIQRAKENPEAVRNGQFRGHSPGGEVTIWVDARGRLQRCSVAKGAVSDGNEQLLAQAFMAAFERARKAAENLEFPEEQHDRRADPQHSRADAAAPTSPHPPATESSRSRAPHRAPAASAGDDDYFGQTSYLR